MSTADDRRADGYQPDFDIDYAFGEQGELFVTNLIDALKRDRVEVKHDGVASSTGNLYFEYQCLRRDGWQPSGLSVTTSDLWMAVVNGCGIVAPVDRVRRVVRPYYRTNQRELVRGSHPTKGVVVPVGRYALDLIRLEAS